MTPTFASAIVPPLRPDVARLVELCVLDRAAADDHGQRPHAFGALARAATRRGDLTASQAAALAALLGLGLATLPANDRA
jgi:hypothetical protein